MVLLITETDEQQALIHAIYEAFSPKMFHVAYTVLKDREQAEEAMQEAFVRIIKHWKSFHQIDENKYLGYCIIVVKNIAIDIYRSRNKYHNIPFDEAENFLPKDHLLEDIVIRKDELAGLLNELSDEYRIPLILRYEKDLAYKDIAHQLAINEDLARKRVQRAIKQLSKNIKEERGA